MIPKVNVLLEGAETIPYANRTYKINLQEKRVEGFIDGEEAVKQAIIKMLNTERFRYEIYNSEYGNELYTLIGKDYLFVQNELKRMVEECLLADDRILSVENFNIEENLINNDSVTVSFVVITKAQENILITGEEVRLR